MPTTKKRVRVTDPGNDKNCCEKCFNCCYSNLILVFIFLAVITGAALGIFLRLFVTAFKTPNVHQKELMYLFFPAELLIRFVNFMTLPLIVSSLISGIGNLDRKIPGRVGLRILLYYVGITIFAVAEGLACVFAFCPEGDPNWRNGTHSEIHDITLHDKVALLLDTLRSIIPDQNVLLSNDILVAGQNQSFNAQSISMSPEAINILGITIICIIFGVTLSSAGGKGRLLCCMFDTAFEILMKIMKVAMWCYPIGIIIITATCVIEMEDPVMVLKKMFVLILTVFVGLFTHVFLVLPVLFLILARKNPYKHMFRCLKVMFTAFATNNRNMTFPVAIDCLESAAYDSRIIRFAVPSGMALNGSGFALYGAASVIFLAMSNGVSFGAKEIAVWGLAVAVVSLFLASSCGSGIVSLIVVLSITGIPLKYIAMLISVDWILSRLCTLTSFWGDCIGVGIIERLSRVQLEQPEVQECNSHSSGEELKIEEAPVLTKYSKLGRRDWTVQLINESGDYLFVSKV